jgi:hypothetical protein
MGFRIVVIVLPVVDCPVMDDPFQLVDTSRIMRGICSVLRPVERVLRQSYESRGRVDGMARMHDGNGFCQCVSPIQSRLILGHCFGEYSYCALRHGVVLLSWCPPEQVCEQRQRAPLKLLPACAQ